MLTLFAVPKAFRGHIGLIQRNAIRTWRAQRPEPDVLLLGDEEGTAEAAGDLGIRHVPDVARNELGTPLLGAVFDRAQSLATSPYVCYVNADLLLLPDFPRALRRLAARRRPFVMVGRRRDVDLTSELDTSAPGWDARLRLLALEEGRLRSPEWIDFFAFPRGLLTGLPPFALGRAGFDNWLLWKARDLGADLVDVTAAAVVIHQNHDYSHHPQGQLGVWEGPEAQRNRELMGTWDRCFFVTDASHRLTPLGVVVPNLSPARLQRSWKRSRRGERLLASWTKLLVRSYPLRRRLGLRRATLEQLSRAISLMVQRRKTDGK